MSKSSGFVFLILLIGGCGGSNEVPTRPDIAPQIMNLAISDNPVCVGEEANVNFLLTDQDSQKITWSAGLTSTGINHGKLDVYSGEAIPGQTVRLLFTAAKSGRHNHRVVLTVTAVDEKQQQATPAEIEIFVFSC